MYKVMDIASYVVGKCNKMNLGIDNMRLQAILYYIQTEFLVTRGRPCFEDDILVDGYGLKVKKVYNNYCYLSSDRFIRLGIKMDDLELIDRVIMAVKNVSTEFLYGEIRGQIPWMDACEDRKVISLESIKDNCSGIYNMWSLYEAMDIANYVVWKYNRNDQFISALYLQKLLYFIQAQFLVMKNVSCFKEDIVAWNFGPVVEDVYHKYRFFLGSHIPLLNNGKVFYGPFYEPGEVIDIERENRVLIDVILEDTYGYSATALLKIIQNQTPWLETYHRSKSKVISRGLIKSYFEEK